MKKEYTPFVVQISDDQKSWIKKEAKAQGVKASVFFRALISYLQEHGVDIKKSLQKSRMETMLQQAEAQVKAALLEKEKIEKQLEEVEA